MVLSLCFLDFYLVSLDDDNFGFITKTVLSLIITGSLEHVLDCLGGLNVKLHMNHYYTTFHCSIYSLYLLHSTQAGEIAIISKSGTGNLGVVLY